MFIPKIIICLRNYSRLTFLQDLSAGLTVGVIALPLAMAFAIASGVPPERWIFTAVVAGFLISVFGGSRVQIGGPTGAFVVIVSGIVASHGYSGLVLCTLMAGILLIVMGFLRLGAMIKFIPFPVVTGFTAGIAVVIFSTQMRDFFGLKMSEIPAEFVPKWIAYGKAANSVSPVTAAIGVGTVAIILILRRFAPRIPDMLVAMVVAGLLTRFLSLPVETIGTRFGDLPRSLPSPSLPPITLDLLRELSPAAITVALLAAIESLLSATVADGMTGNRHKSNMELVAQEIANIGASLMGGISARGAYRALLRILRVEARHRLRGIYKPLLCL